MRKLLVGVVALFAVMLGFPAAAGAVTPTTITLLHGIPGVTVDVYVDGTLTFDDFAPGETKDLSALAGAPLTNVEVKLQDGTVVIGPATFTLPDDGENWTFIAYLNASGTPVLGGFINDVSPTLVGEGRLIVRHTAAAPAVDLYVGTDLAFEELTNGDGLDWPTVSEFDELVGDVPAPLTIDDATLTPHGATTPVIPVPAFTVPEGMALIVYAVGSLEDQTFTYYEQLIPVEHVVVGVAGLPAKLALGSLVTLVGAGLLLVARRRPAVV